MVRPLLAEDKERRYVTDQDVAIPVSKDATIMATVVRPRTSTSAGILPTLLEFTLDRTNRDAREAAAHGYVSVLALARIAGDPKSRPRAPFESEGDDARAVIEWIAKQPWSDGRVGMQGSGLRRLRRVVGSEATAGCVEGDRDIRPDGARHRRAESEPDRAELRLSMGLRAAGSAR